jgi:fermentation-respiration switch protein FrsA (DUF1100 family)
MPNPALREEGTMRTDITFRTEDGVTLRGWFYQPENRDGPFPTLVMTHGFSAIKEQGLDAYATVFCQGGFAVLVYDHWNLGTSDGEPRGEILPSDQIRDYRDAITFALTLPMVDKEHMGIWGTSYSGGHVIVVAAIDRRVKCVVSQVPYLGGFETSHRLVTPLALVGLRQAFDADRLARYQGAAPRRLPVVPTEPHGTEAILPHEPARQFFEAMRERAPTWQNEATLRSAEAFLEYDPSPYMGQIAPTPLLLVVTDRDTIVPTDIALRIFTQQAFEPKQVVLVPGEHFEVYTGRGLALSSQAALAWFRQWLMPVAR